MGSDSRMRVRMHSSKRVAIFGLAQKRLDRAQIIRSLEQARSYIGRRRKIGSVARKAVARSRRKYSCQPALVFSPESEDGPTSLRQLPPLSQPIALCTLYRAAVKCSECTTATTFSRRDTCPSRFHHITSIRSKIDFSNE